MGMGKVGAVMVREVEVTAEVAEVTVTGSAVEVGMERVVAVMETVGEETAMVAAVMEREGGTKGQEVGVTAVPAVLEARRVGLDVPEDGVASKIARAEVERAAAVMVRVAAIPAATWAMAVLAVAVTAAARPSNRSRRGSSPHVSRTRHTRSQGWRTRSN